MKKLAILISLFLAAAVARATTVSGTINVNGVPFNGYLSYQLITQGIDGSVELPIPSPQLPIKNGSFGSLTIPGNDVITGPSGTFYLITYYDAYKKPIVRSAYVITGSTFDLGQAVPTPITIANVNYQDLLNIRNLSVTNLTIQNGGQLQFGTGTIINQAGISQASVINSIVFAQYWETSSSTCGLQEAFNSLPAAGGWIVAPNGTCTMTSNALLTGKPIWLIGYGAGGVADVINQTTYSGGTQLINGSVSQNMITIGVGSAPTLGGDRISNLSLIGNKAVGGATTGSALVIAGGTTATATFHDVLVDQVFIYGSKGDNVIVQDNTPSVTFQNIQSVYGAAKGLNVLTTGTQNPGNVNIVRSSITNNGDSGIAASVGSVHVDNSNISNNTTNEILFTGGARHSVANSTVLGTTTNGINMNMPAGAAGVEQLRILENDIQNHTCDINQVAAVTRLLIYPQATTTAASTVHYCLANAATALYVVTGPTPTSNVQGTTHAGCTTTSSSYDVCNVTLTWPNPWPDTAYAYSCSALDSNVIGGGSSDALTATVFSISTTQITVVIQTQRSNVASPSAVSCIGWHP